MQAFQPLRAQAPRQIRVLNHSTRSLPRTSLRASRNASRRYQSTEASPAAKGGSSGAIAGGLAGGFAAFLFGYTWYRLSGTKTLVDYAHESKKQIDNAFKSATDKAPKANEAVTWLKETVTGYTKLIPGANQYVEQAFEDIEKVQEKHGDEVNKIINDTYGDLKDITKQGASLAAASQAWDVLQKCLKRIGELAGDAMEDILKNHPELKEKIGGRYKQLQQMAEQYGPEAKKQVDDTIKQVQDIVKGGFSSENIEKAKKLVEEKTEELKKYGEKAWDEGMKKVQPVLDKNPELKETIDKNKDKLLQGDLGQLWDKVQEAAKSGNTDDVKKFVQEQVQKGQESLGGSGQGIEQLLGSMFPGGKDVGAKFQQLQELSQKHGKEAEKLIRSAFDDIKKVLEKKVEEGKELKGKVEQDSKS